MIDILNITGEPIFDNRIVKIETHTYNPFANTTFGYSDEIRIPIQQQDLYTLPCESFLYVERRLTVKKKRSILEMKKLSARWVPRLLTVDQKQQRSGGGEGEGEKGGGRGGG
ncbi:hypothetical protein ALC57_06427 [Trachymyrmex cornetzi]|uniref:Uncharacterized protein n=1 Tax=Trachymyrmex cornetzi TaxID=471704 RepID=A0A151J8L6_9HYME|nr:hypothetical protein ALC57_06427 [Trachymyrmex cornetzi]